MASSIAGSMQSNPIYLPLKAGGKRTAVIAKPFRDKNMRNTKDLKRDKRF